METKEQSVADAIDNDYKYGFTTNVESDTFAKGLDLSLIHI